MVVYMNLGKAIAAIIWAIFWVIIGWWLKILVGWFTKTVR